MDIFNSVYEFVMSHLVATGGIAAVVEFLLRVIPSEKPLSIAHAIVAFLRKCVEIVAKIVDMLKAVADFLDKILPQAIKQ